jgi:hypothetical protein
VRTEEMIFVEEERDRELEQQMEKDIEKEDAQTQEEQVRLDVRTHSNVLRRRVRQCQGAKAYTA